MSPCPCSTGDDIAALLAYHPLSSAEADAGTSLTIFMYGDSGTGKSHTVKHLLAHAADHLIASSPQTSVRGRSPAVFLSAYELKHEIVKVYDLVDDRPGKNSKPLKHACRKPKSLKESRGFDIDGLCQIRIGSKIDLANAIRKINQRKEVKATKNNPGSSRSHCVFELVSRDHHSVWTCTLTVSASRCQLCPASGRVWSLVSKG